MEYFLFGKNTWVYLTIFMTITAMKKIWMLRWVLANMPYYVLPQLLSENIVRIVTDDYVGHEGIYNTESTWHVSVGQIAYMFI